MIGPGPRAADDGDPLLEGQSLVQDPSGDEATIQRGSIFGLASASYVTMLLGFVTGPLLSRAVGPTGRGEIALVSLYSTLALTGLSAGVPLAVSHHVANRLHTTGEVVATALRFCRILIIPSFLLTALLLGGPLRSISTGGIIGALAVLLTTPVGVLSSCLTLFLIGQGALRGLTRTQLLPAASLALGTLIAYILGQLTVASYLIMVMLSALLTVSFAWHAVGVRPSTTLPLRPFVGFGLRGYGAYMATLGSVRIDQAFVGSIAGSRMLGFYAVSATVALVPLTLARAIAARSFGRVGSAPPDQKVEIVSEFMRVSILITGSFAAIIAVACPIAIPLLYGRLFTTAVVPVLILLPGTVFLGASASASASLVALGRPGRAMIAEAVGLAVTLIGLPLVVSRFGIRGAAVLSTVAYAATFGAYRIQLRKIGRMRVRPGIADISNIMNTSVDRMRRRKLELRRARDRSV